MASEIGDFFFAACGGGHTAGPGTVNEVAQSRCATKQLLARAVHQEGDEQHVVTEGQEEARERWPASNYGRDEWWVLLAQLRADRACE